jgi:hypothetical protein
VIPPGAGNAPPNVAFQPDFVGTWLVNGAISHVRLLQREDELQWNLHSNGKLCVDSMYTELVHSDVLVDNKK